MELVAAVLLVILAPFATLLGFRSWRLKRKIFGTSPSRTVGVLVGVLVGVFVALIVHRSSVRWQVEALESIRVGMSEEEALHKLSGVTYRREGDVIVAPLPTIEPFPFTYYFRLTQGRVAYVDYN